MISGVERQTCLAMSSNCLPLPDSRFWIVKPKSFAFSDSKSPLRNEIRLISSISQAFWFHCLTTQQNEHLLHQSCRWRLVICAFTYSYCFPLLLNYPELHAMKRRHLEVPQNRSLLFFSVLRESRLNLFFFFFFFFNTREPSIDYGQNNTRNRNLIRIIILPIIKHIYREGWEVRNL